MSGGVNMQNERLYRLCQALGVCRDDQWLSEAAIEAIEKLQAAIAKHHGQHADDLCYLDDNELYAAAGLPPREPTVGDPEAMLANCKRYIAQRCKPGGEWKSYAELEAENATLRAATNTIFAALLIEDEKILCRPAVIAILEDLKKCVSVNE